MKKYIILSVNDNQDYLYYTPLTCYLWYKLGWFPIVIYHGYLEDCPLDAEGYPTEPTTEKGKIVNLALSTGPFQSNTIRIPEIEGYRSDTITQTSRLYGACVCEEDSLIMTGDVDMLPLSDYWHPDPSKITVYGHDLTGYTEYPICYISMMGKKWVELMGIGNTNDIATYLKQGLDSIQNAKSTDFYKYWSTDQQLATERIKAFQAEKDFINRGQYPNGYAKGRVDRGAWTLEHEQFIDCHMHRDLFKAFYPDSSDTNIKKWSDTMRMLEKCFPGENFDWFENYTKEYAKLAYGK